MSTKVSYWYWQFLRFDIHYYYDTLDDRFHITLDFGAHCWLHIRWSSPRQR